jgi:hypothetical protein
MKEKLDGFVWEGRVRPAQATISWSEAHAWNVRDLAFQTMFASLGITRCKCALKMEVAGVSFEMFSSMLSVAPGS